ncbi:hypothetical protein V2E39_21340 [Chryseobacterium arthrosphaerae]|uniref:Lipoprotein n=1 Tax=Chryseobacterium arthrosphaerae TaxID=651561 RepID=A0ABU7R573_9FLAO|nr:hypothetical protein [Chryseobacterium arthrosphaerae]
MMRKRSKLLLSLIVMWTLSCKEKVKQDNQQSALPFRTTENIVEKKENTSHKSTQDTLISKETVYKINSDFNNYKTKYSIEVLKNSSDKDAYDQLHFNLPVRIYKGNTLWKSNDHLIFDKRNSCISEGFSTVVVKNNYFTIEHQDCSDYNILVNAYITFKVSGNEIYLYKYGGSYFDKSNHERNIPTKTWTEKNFGKIKFEEVTAELLQKLE